MVDVLGHDIGGNAACKTARNGIYGRDDHDENTVYISNPDYGSDMQSSGDGFETADSDNDDEDFQMTKNKIDIELGSKSPQI